MDANEAGSVSSNVGTQLPQNAEASSRSVMGFFKLIFAHKAISIITIVLLIIIGVAIFAGQKLYQANKATSPVASRFDDQKIPLGSAVAPGALQLNTSQALSINGQLRANNTLVLSPSTQPTRGTAGQLYYDSAASKILYHNGQTFIAVADTTQTDQLQAQLQTTASQAEVASIAAQLQALQGQLGQIQVPANLAQLDTVNNFSAQNTFAAGLTAASLSVSGATTLGSTTASSLILSNPLGVASGGTGQSLLPLNGVLVGQGANPVAAVTAGAAGQCLISTAGAPVFQACPGGSGGGVDTLNGLSGALTLANASAAGSTITINDATTASKGIASFNATNFSVAGGVVNTAQNISVSAAPTFAGLTLNGSLTIGSNSIVTSGSTIGSAELDVLDGGINETEVTGVITDVTAGNGITGGGASGAVTLNVVSANGGITVSADNIALALQPSGDALSTTTSSGSGLEILAGGLSLLQGCSDSQVLKWNEGGDVWECSTDASGGNISGSGTTNRLPRFTGGTAIGDSSISDDGTNVTTTSNLIIQGGNVTAGTSSQLGSFVLNDGNGQTTTLRAGDSAGNLTLTLPTTAGAQYQCLKYDTGGQLIWDNCEGGAGGASVTSLNGLTGGLTIQGNAQVAVNTSSPNINLSIQGDSIGDAQLAFNTGQHLTTTSTPTFAGVTLNGNLALGTNSITTSGGTIGSNELDVLDGGIDESEVTGVITDVTAGNGLTGGAAAGNATLNVVSANGGITVSADNIALALQPSGDALSTTTSSGSGLEILAGGLSLLQGCSNAQVLKWNEGTDVWECASDTSGGNISGSGTTNQIAKFTGGSAIGDSSLSDDGSTVTATGNLVIQGGNVTAGTSSQLGALILNDGNGQTTTLRAGDSVGNLSLTLPTSAGSQYQCLKYDTGGQLIWDNCEGGSSGGSGVTSLNGLDGSLTIQGNAQIAVSAVSPNINLSIQGDSIGDTQLAFNTGQHLTTTSAPTFAGLTLNGNLTIGTNSIVTGATTIGSTELDVLDGGIDETEVTGAITDVTAGNGLTGGGASGNVALNIASANGAITVNADNIAFTLQPSGDALSSTTSSGSGMEILSTGLSLIQGCSDGQILKWNEATDTWGCAADAGGSGVGDDVYINGSNADGAKFIDSAATGTSAGIVWSLNTTPVPDEITLSVSNASATEAGVVTTGVQSFAGDKTFNNAATIAGLFTANGGITVEAGDTFTFNGEAFTDLTGTGLTISGGALQVANDAITDTQLAFNTGQHLTVTSSPTFAGLTANGNITIGTNSIVTGATTISSTELDVLDGGIDETEVTGAVTDVTAGSGLTGGGASGNVTLNITSANGGIAVNADNIALTLQPSGDALSTATSSGSGLEILSTGLTLLQGCSDAQVLKWNETTDTWGCAADAGGSGLGDDVLINGTNADAANFLNTTATGTSAGITWNLNTTPNPDEITLSVSNASTTEAGVVTTGTQGFSGFKTFNGGIATPIIRPVSDSTTALNIQNAAGTTNILTVDSTNARIGIGATPSHKLHVADTTTANSGTNNMAAFFNYNVDPSSLPAATTTYYGQQTFVTSSSVNLNANVTMYGDVATVQNAGSATLGAAVGTGAVAQNSGTGVITNAIAGRFKASNTGSGSITNAVALQASTPEVTAGSIGTAYGLFIETQDVSGVGTGYGIWQAGAADLNVFAGKVGIGMVPSTHALEVNGTGLFGTSVLTQTIDTYSAAALNVGTANATQINLNKNVVVAANQSLTITGGATGTRPASPTEGMVYFDTTTKQLLTYANGKWQANRAEAIIVAASNSSQADKDAADYVADGNTGAAADGDQVQINQALTAGSGKRVVLLAGTYVADATILIPNNTILSGVGQGTVIELADLDASDNLIEGSDTSTGTSVGIRDLKLDGRSDLNTAGVQRAISFTAMGGGSGSTARQGARVSHVTLHRFRSESLHLSNSRNGQFTNNTIIASGSDGILVSGSSYNTFTGNLVQGGSGGAVLIGGSSTHNTFTNNTIQGNTNTGISISNSTQNTVTGNTITGGSFGVFLSTVASENTITGNTIKSTTSDSINVGTSSNNVTISGNTVMSSSASGIAVSSNSVTVSGNTISSSSSAGINITGDNNVVDGNSIAASSLYGIILNSANNTVVTNNRISDSGGATNNNGIYIFSSDSNQVAANSVTDSSATTTNYAINVNNATSDTNYLSGNTLGTGSINDAGTGTIYGGQVNNSGNYLLQPSGSIELLKNTNVTGNLTATGTLQGTQLISTVATGTAPLTVNSTTLVANLNTDLLDGQHGSFYQDASNINAGTLAVNRGGTGAGSFTQYGILFGNGTGAFGVTAAGSTGQCLLATTGAAPTWGSCASVSLQGAYDTSTGSPLITLTDNKDFSITAPDTATDSSIVFNLNCTTCSANGGRFAVQDAGVDIFTINPNGDIIIGTSTNNITLASGAGYEPILNGTARHQKKITLNAEYVGATLDVTNDTLGTVNGTNGATVNCSTNSSGSMTSGYTTSGVSSRPENYYQWSSTQATAQCYDVVVQVAVPSDFESWNGTGTLNYFNSSTNSRIHVDIRDTAGNVVGNAYGTTLSATGAWTAGALPSLTGTYTPGDSFTLRIRMSAQSVSNAKIGKITLNYYSKY